MNKNQKQFKLLYKLILTFILVVIIPLVVTNIILINFIDNQDEIKIEERLKYGRDYIESILKYNQTISRSNALSLSNNNRLISVTKDVIYGQSDIKKEDNTLYKLLADYKFDLIALYDQNFKEVYNVKNIVFKNISISIDKSDIKKGLAGFYASECLVSDGIVLLTFINIKIGNQPYVFVTGNRIQGDLLDQLRSSLNMDFTLVPNNKRILTTLFDAYGNPVVNTWYEVPYHVVEKFAQIDDEEKRKGIFVDGEVHLNKIYKSYYYLMILEGGKDVVIWAIISQQIDYSSSKIISQYLFLILLFSILLSVIAIIFIATRIISPVQVLANKIKQLVVQIEQQEEIDLIEAKSNDEIKTLAQNFNQMAVSLQEAYTKLIDYSQNLEKKVERRTKELANRGAELEKLNKELKIKNDSINWELKVASVVQKTLLPDSHIECDKFEIVSKLMPMTQTSGDYIDVWEIDDGIYAILVIDVSGHGVPSALITTMAKVSFRNNATIETNTAQVCSNVNLDLQKSLSKTGFYFTAFLCIFNSIENTLEFTNAGHPPAIIINKNNVNITPIDTEGFAMGTFTTVMYENKTIKLSSGERLFIYSDGIIGERLSITNTFYDDDERFANLLKSNYNVTINEFIENLLKDINDFTNGAPPTDDRSILILDIK